MSKSRYPWSGLNVLIKGGNMHGVLAYWGIFIHAMILYLKEFHRNL